LLKQYLISEPIVDYPRKHRPYSLIVDASTGTGEINGGLGTMFYQTNEDCEERVIAYASRQLLKHEKNYTPFLAEMQAMDHFDTYLRARQFTALRLKIPLTNNNKNNNK
jgi:hypothetical protein